MADHSNIEWCDSTYNFWEGCTKVGPGCDNCYAEARNARFAGGQAINWGPGAPRRITSENNRNNLQRWNRKAFAQCDACGWRGESPFPGMGDACPRCKEDLVPARRRVFCSSLSDVFDNEVDQAWRDAMFAEMEACPNLDFLVLTKRIGNVRRMVPAAWLTANGWPKQVRLGATIVNQPEADRDILKLLELPCPNFLSMEPLLGPVSFEGLFANPRDMRDGTNALEAVEWVIVGGESGPKARPMHPDWVRDLRDQCEAAGVPFLFKQWGEWTPGENVTASRGTVPTAKWFNQQWDIDRENLACEPYHCDYEPDLYRTGKKAAGRLLDGQTHDGFPAHRAFEDGYEHFDDPKPVCERCHGDGRDPWNDYLFPCPECKGGDL